MIRFLPLSVAVLLAANASAQTTHRTLISRVDANRVSLQRAWFTRVRVDPARGRIAHVTQHVSSKHAYTVYVVTHDRGKLNFSERDIDRFGRTLGKDGAKKLADRHLADLTLQKLNPKLSTQTIPETSLYVMTDMGMVQAIDGETGRTRWTTPVGNPFYYSEAPGANDDYVAAVNGSSIFVIDQANGKIVWRRQARGAPGAGPAVTALAVFVPMLNGAVESYQLLDHRRPPRILKSHGRAIVQPIYTGSNVAWPTDRGHLNVAEERRSKMRFRLETNNHIVARATALSPGRLLTASTDGYLYCIDEMSGDIQWRFSTGEPLLKAPIVVGDSIYLVTEDRTLFCLSADLGRMHWSTTGIRGFLAASEKRLYCSNTAGRLQIIHAATGSPLGSLPTEALDLRVANHQTDRIYLGSRHGVIQCLHEVEQEWPHIHAGVLEERPAKQPARKASGLGTPAAAEEAPLGNDEDPFSSGDSPAAGGDDPFGDGDDPFGGEGAGSDPFGGGDGGGDDPFGGDGGSDGDDPFGGDSGGDGLF